MTTAVAQRQWSVPLRAATDAGVLVERFAVEDGPVVGLVFRRYADPEAHQGPLTRQQLAVLRLVAEGNSNGEVGKALYVSEDTVKSHLLRLCRVIGARDRANAVAIAMREGWLL